jgi:PHD/YefM family antitoxin component YafN of YafNO toxin-antitoxin module
MYTVSYASKRREVWRWYWRAWMRPVGLWRFHALFGLIFAFVFAVLLDPGAFRLKYFLSVAAMATASCVILFPLWPQIRFNPAVRSLSIDAEGIKTSIGKVSGSRLWKEVQSVDERDGAIVITGKNQNAFIIPARAFTSDEARRELYEAARQWHGQAVT